MGRSTKSDGVNSSRNGNAKPVPGRTTKGDGTRISTEMANAKTKAEKYAIANTTWQKKPLREVSHPFLNGAVGEYNLNGSPTGWILPAPHGYDASGRPRRSPTSDGGIGPISRGAPLPGSSGGNTGGGGTTKRL